MLVRVAILIYQLPYYYTNTLNVRQFPKVYVVPCNAMNTIAFIIIMCDIANITTDFWKLLIKLFGLQGRRMLPKQRYYYFKCEINVL